jgi:hypothetical protein
MLADGGQQDTEVHGLHSLRTHTPPPENGWAR